MAKWVFEAPEQKSSGDYGNLVDGTFYKVEFTGMKYLEGKAYPMAFLNAKVTEGETGIGTYISNFYGLNDAGSEKLKGFQQSVLAVLHKIGGLSDMDFAGMEDDEILKKSLKAVEGKTAWVKVEDDGEYNGKKKWKFNPYSPTVTKPYSVGKKPDVVLDEMTLTTPAPKATEIKDDFSF